MRKLLVLLGAFLLFTYALFGAERSNNKEVALFESTYTGPFEKLSNISCPYAGAIILPQTFQYLTEHNPTDQAKKIKAFLGSSFEFRYFKSRFPAIRFKRVQHPALTHPLFILFQNLRI
jgi:hypothetical protein